MNGIGMIFPKIQIGIAVIAGILRRLAASSPPLNSKIGISDMINTTVSGVTYGLRYSANHLTNESITPPRLL